ncbi:MAG: ATP-binding protein [Mariniblastus sp.]|nr:ATP-binding protein [Mariniblastus sp.]
MNQLATNNRERLFGHYEVLQDRAREDSRPQKRGEFGLVRDARNGHEALIRYLPEKYFSTNRISRFKNQLRLLARIKTGSFLAPIEFGHQDGFVFSVQQPIPYPTLSEYFGRTGCDSLGLEQALDLAHNILRVLQEVHSTGCVLGTLEPSSIYYDGQRAALNCPGPCDFLDPSGDEGQAIEFAKYASPEMAGSIEQDVGPPSDLYSFGVLLYRLLAGRTPFQGQHVGQIIIQHVTTRPDFTCLDSRVPPVLKEILAHLLKKEPCDRYQSAASVLHDIEHLIRARHQGNRLDQFVVGRSDARSSIIEPALVGRTAELECLTGRLEMARRGSGQVVAVSCPSGIGKTRLVHELIQDATGKGFALYRGMATNQAGQLPMSPWLEIIRQFALNLKSDPQQRTNLHQELADYREEISTILPEFAEQLGWNMNRLMGPDELGAKRVNQAVVKVLTQISTEQAPALIWIDDTQWLDPRSLDILQLIQSGPLRHAMLVLSLRPNEGVSPAVFERVAIDTHIELQPLNPGEIRALLESMAGVLPAVAIETIVKLSAGSPFMGSAILRGMVESGALVAKENRWTIEPEKMADIQASRDAAEALWKRLAQVPPPILNQLSIAAIIGKEFDGHTIVELTGMSFEQARANFDWCRNQRLIWAMRDGNYSFVHDSIRETLIRRLSDQQRAQWNNRFAQQLERNEPDRWFEIACHYDAAGNAAQAFPFALKAAAQARKQYSLIAAEELLRIADRGLKATASPERHQVESGLADVLMLLGRYDEADQWFVRAQDSAKSATEKARTAMKRGELEFKRGHKEKAVLFFEEAVHELGYRIPAGRFRLLIQLARQVMTQAFHTIFPQWFVGRCQAFTEKDRLTCRIFSKLAYGYWYTRGKYRTFWAHFAGMNLAERHPPTLELAQAYSEHAPGMSLIPWHSRGIKYARRSLDIRQKLNDVWGQGQSRNFYSILLYSSSQFQECIEQAQHAESILVRTGDAWEMNIARYQWAASMYRMGKLPEALKLAKQTYESALAIGDFQSTGNIIDIWARASLGQMPDEVIQRERSRSLLDHQGQCQVLLAEGICLFYRGQYSRSGKCFLTAIKRAERAGVVNTYITPNYAWLATALRRELENSPPRSQAARRRSIRGFLKAAKRAVKISRRFQNELPHALRELAAALALSGRPKRAKRLLQESLVVAQQQDAAYEVALTRKMFGSIGRELQWPGSEELVANATSQLESLDHSVSEHDQETSLSLIDRFDTLLSSGREIASAMRRDLVLERTLQASQSLLRGQRTLILQVHKDRVAIVAGPADRAFDPELVKQAMETRKTVVCEQEKVLQHGTPSRNTGGFLCSPITVNDRTEMCIYVANDLVKGLYGENEIRIADYLSSAAGAALEKARGFQQLAELNQTLEQKVLERTAAVEARSHELEITADELRRTQTDLEIARDEAEAANSAKSSFLARISHEIRTPISAVIGFTELMLRGVVTNPREQNRNLETIHASGNHLLQLINDLLDISKIEADKIEVESMECEPARIAQEVLSTLKARSVPKGVELDLRILGLIPRTITSDPTRLRQILTNIIGNAVKFTEQGQVVVDIRVDETSRQLTMEIRDTGIGMTEQQLEKIFDPFTQADSSTTRRFGGTGLGLSISQRLMEILGGSMSVQSSPGRGSCFTLRLPFETSSDREMVDSNYLVEIDRCRHDRSWSPVQLKGLKALVVDDSETNRELLSIVLGEAGAMIETRENGQQALDRLQQGDSVDVVLMDMQMPILDGYTATEQLRQLGFDKPIIALTANSMKGDEERCLAAGCNDYVSKPIDFDRLLEKLDRIFQDRLSCGESMPASSPTQTLSIAGTAERIDQQARGTVPALEYPADEPFRSLSRKFIDKIRNRLPELNRAIEEQDFSVIGQMAHWIKGTGGTVGLPQLSEISIQIEEAVKRHALDETRTHCQRLGALVSLS